MATKRDAYSRLFELIDKDQLFNIGINDIIYLDENKIQENWAQLKRNLFNNEEVYIRAYGRDGKGNLLYQELYNILFENSNIKIDPSNNTKPTKILSSLTSYSKTKMKNKTLIMNYQISHLFGKTKNPLLFTSPWNIAYIPKYIDPFTGHETQGEYSSSFKEILLPILKEKFRDYIQNYNSIIREKVSGKIDESLNLLKQSQHLNEKVFKKLSDDVKNELAEISIN
jgi:hypothetical protein